MTRNDWDQTAKQFAQEMGKYRLLVERGVVPFRFYDDTTLPPRTIDAAPLVVGVFGNDNKDNSVGDSLAKLEVEQIRNRLKDTAVQELGFGVSADGSTWALLIEAEKNRFQTAAGREFQKELLRIFLEDVVWDAWRTVACIPPEFRGSV